MAVNTPDGPTDRKTIENSVLQGDVFGSLMASVQVDSIGKECAAAGYGYKYKNFIPVGMLGLVDDTICISEAGFKAQMLNVFFNIKTAEKKPCSLAQKSARQCWLEKILKAYIVVSFLWINGLLNTYKKTILKKHV